MDEAAQRGGAAVLVDESDSSGTASITTDPAIAVRLNDLAKAYGSTQALKSCSLTLRAGQVHAVVGENGSGKSTMVKVLTGITHPDRGTIDVGGVVRRVIHGPQEALAEGIVGVFQNMMVVETQSVLDNIWLGADGVVRRHDQRGDRRTRGAEVLEQLLGKVPDLDGEAGDLPLSEHQALGLARALLRDPKVLILDEATSALDIATRDRLFEILKRLAEAGSAIVFISHRMDEIEEIGDVITVMRAGETVASVARGDVSVEEIVSIMAGAEHAERVHAEARHAAAREQDPRSSRVVLRAEGIKVDTTTEPFDEAIYEGELVGVAGLEGHGQERFLQILAGSRPTAGTVTLCGESDVVLRSRRHAYRHGVAYVPRDRTTEGIFETLAINDNFALATIAEDGRFGLVSRKRTRKRLAEYIASLKIKLGDPQDPISTLSGGNQQKVVLARWLAVHPHLLLLDDPTRGIDPGAKRDLYELLVELTGNGMAVVMVSTDVDELVELADRVVVFREGTVSREIPRNELTRHALVSSFFGR